jgi:hypothetical protein
MITAKVQMEHVAGTDGREPEHETEGADVERA